MLSLLWKKRRNIMSTWVAMMTNTWPTLLLNKLLWFVGGCSFHPQICLTCTPSSPTVWTRYLRPTSPPQTWRNSHCYIWPTQQSAYSQKVCVKWLSIKSVEECLYQNKTLKHNPWITCNNDWLIDWLIGLYTVLCPTQKYSIHMEASITHIKT